MSYLVYVEGKDAPSKIHTFLVDAEAEVTRLAAQKDNQMRKIHIVQIVKTSEPVVTRKWNVVDRIDVSIK